MKTRSLTQKRLKELLDYNPETGIFNWIVGRSGTKGVGCIAGYLKPDGYIYIGIDYILYPAHGLAFLYMIGQFPENQIDHKHRNKSDNRWSEIREVTPSCNQRNTGNRCNNTSGVKGISWSKNANAWIAHIRTNKKQWFLRQSKDFDEVVCHRLATEQCLGWNGCDDNSPALQYVQNLFGR